jgi:excinuclease UvrABC nuclease subunit
MDFNLYDYKCRNAAGVYVVYLDGILRYVGQSGNLRQRMASHGFCDWDFMGAVRYFKGMAFIQETIYWTECRDGLQRLELERRLIAEHQPELNQKDNPGWTPKTKHPIPERYVVTGKFKAFVKMMGSQAKAAQVLSISPSHVSLLTSGKRKISPDLAEKIELASGGQITKESLVFKSRRI